MRIGAIAAFAVLFVVSACDGSSDNESAQNTSSNEAVALPAPNYIENKDGVYYYTSAVSENDKMAGRAAGDILGFKYKGKNKIGDFVIESTAGGVFTCSDPCKVIHFSDGEAVAYTPDSVIGAVFTDALNGFLKTGRPS